MITEEEATRIMAIVHYPSFADTTYNPDYISRLDQAFGGKSYYFGGPPTFWHSAIIRAGSEMWGVTGLIRMLGEIRKNAFKEADLKKKLSPVWFRENK